MKKCKISAIFSVLVLSTGIAGASCYDYVNVKCTYFTKEGTKAPVGHGLSWALIPVPQPDRWRVVSNSPISAAPTLGRITFKKLLGVYVNNTYSITNIVLPEVDMGVPTGARITLTRIGEGGDHTWGLTRSISQTEDDASKTVTLTTTCTETKVDLKSIVLPGTKSEPIYTVNKVDFKYSKVPVKDSEAPSVEAAAEKDDKCDVNLDNQ